MTSKNRSKSLVFQIDQLLDEVSELAKSESSFGSFFATLLQRASLAVDAQAAALWVLGPNSSPMPINSTGLESINFGTSLQNKKAITAVEKTISDCIVSGKPKKLSLESNQELTLFAWPITNCERNDSAIALYVDSKVTKDLEPIYLSFVEAIAEIAGEYFQRNSTETSAKPNRSDWSRFKALSDSLHESLDVKSTAVTLVNLGRSYYQCDRVFVAKRMGRRGSNFKIIAASGAVALNQKSETIRALTKLVTRAFIATPNQSSYLPIKKRHPTSKQHSKIIRVLLKQNS